MAMPDFFLFKVIMQLIIFTFTIMLNLDALLS